MDEVIELELSSDTIAKLALTAHVRELTLERHINEILKEWVDEHGDEA